MEANFVEQNCVFEFEGKAFESGGSYIVDCTDGKQRGAVYVNPAKKIVTTWHGEKIASLDTYTRYQGNFCRMARISFTLNGRKFVGDYCPDWADLCRVRSTK